MEIVKDSGGCCSGEIKKKKTEVMKYGNCFGRDYEKNKMGFMDEKKSCSIKSFLF